MHMFKILEAQRGSWSRPGEYCRRCLHYWIPRTSVPIEEGARYKGWRKTERAKRCPSCRSKYWDTERTNRQGMRPGS